jgi:hypothetical protein
MNDNRNINFGKKKPGKNPAFPENDKSLSHILKTPSLANNLR